MFASLVSNLFLMEIASHPKGQLWNVPIILNSAIGIQETYSSQTSTNDEECRVTLTKKKKAQRHSHTI